MRLLTFAIKMYQPMYGFSFFTFFFV